GASVSSSDNMATADPPTGSGTTTITVNLHNVSNAQRLTVTLANVSNGTVTGPVSIPMAVLLGDTTADGTVNSADITQTRRQSGNVAHGDPNANFREDTTTDGTINSADITQVRRQSGTALPP